MLFKKIFIILALSASAITLNAQASQSFINQNAWVNNTIIWSISPKWSIHQEVQWRRNEYFNFPQQTLLRGGLTRDIGAGLSVTAGYAYVHSSAYGAIPSSAEFDEHRIWQQLQQKNTHSKFEFTARLRLEQRWVESPTKIKINNIQFQSNEFIYSYRARFMEKVNIALYSKDAAFKDNCLYLSLMDEYFASFGTNVTTNIFDQNRAFIGIGYVVPRIGRLEIGYLNQTVNKGYANLEENGVSRILNKREVNHTLSVSLFTAIKTWKEEKNN
jgi:hypothetical protein